MKAYNGYHPVILSTRLTFVNNEVFNQAHEKIIFII